MKRISLESWGYGQHRYGVDIVAIIFVAKKREHKRMYRHLALPSYAIVSIIVSQSKQFVFQMRLSFWIAKQVKVARVRSILLWSSWFYTRLVSKIVKAVLHFLHTILSIIVSPSIQFVFQTRLSFWTTKQVKVASVRSNFLWSSLFYTRLVSKMGTAVLHLFHTMLLNNRFSIKTRRFPDGPFILNDKISQGRKCAVNFIVIFLVLQASCFQNWHRRFPGAPFHSEPQNKSRPHVCGRISSTLHVGFTLILFLFVVIKLNCFL